MGKHIEDRDIDKKEKQVARASIEDEELPSISWEEIRKHTTPPDCWMVIHGRVYNVAPVLSIHPGGSQILLHYAGRDATYPFDDVGHSMESLVFDMPEGTLKGKLESSNEEKIQNEYINQNEDNTEKEDVVVTQKHTQSYVAIWDKIYTVLLYCVILVCAILLTCLRWRNGESQEVVNEDIPAWVLS